jgi:serine protease inhibitor
MKRKLLLSLIITIIIAFTGCAEPQDTSVTTSASQTDTSTTASQEASAAYANPKKNNKIISGNIEFSLDIFKQINKTDKHTNIVISPYSISAALSMVYLGADSKTREAMQSALNYEGITDEDFARGQKYLKSFYESADESVDILVSNSLWIREGNNAKQDFIDKNTDIFDAVVRYLDFDDPSSADAINQWIDDSTKGLISKLISGPIPNDVFMYLVNAVYFKGEWTESFEVKKTKKMEFFNEDGKKSIVDMMNMKNDMYYKKQGSYKTVRIPYGDQILSMYCILPNEEADINDFIDSLDKKKWDEIRDIPDKTADVLLMLPRFEIEYGIRSLNEELKQMGMKIAFTYDADFTGIAPDLYISNVLHKAVIEVNEQGTKAAAATSVEVSVTSMPIDMPEFIANRPFIFVIADDQDGSILFMGKISGF